MIVDKVPWISHEDGPIFCIDVHPDGNRVATCGNDNKIKIWNLQPVLHEPVELDTAIPRVLATLTDHCACVNVARFSRNGKYLASGSDDKVVCIHELRPGPGASMFGSKDAPNIENWKQVQNLRGHDNNVSDLCWSPDDKYVASASLDNLVHIWEAATGRLVHTIRAHKGFVKGVAWDPFNVYLATQGENDGVFIWRVDGWTRIAHITKHLVPNLGCQSFNARPCWSPDGQTLAMAGGFCKPSFTAPLVSRGKWDVEFSFVGHRASITSVRYNPKLFFPRKDPQGEEACPLAAVLSADKQFTVWSPTEKTPLLVGSSVFKGGVMEGAWTPDGHALLLASYDGSVAVCRFSPQELGRVVPEAEVQALFAQLFGDTRARGKVQALAESADLLRMEQELAGPAPEPVRVSKQQSLNSRLGGGGGGGGAAGSSAPAAAMAPPPAPAGPNAGAGAAQDTRKRLQPTPSAAQGAGHTAPAATPVMRSPSRGSGAAAQAAGGAPAAKRQAVAAADVVGGSVPAAAPTPAPAGAGAAAVAAPPSRHVLPVPAVQVMVSATLGMKVVDEMTGREAAVVLEAANVHRDQRGQPLAEVAVSCEGRQLWVNRVPGSVVKCAGTLNFAAVATSSGDMLVFSPAGRRVFPAIRLGGPAAFLVADSTAPGMGQLVSAGGSGAAGWRLLVVTSDGQLRMWDLQLEACVLEASVAPLLEEGHRVNTVRLSSAGAPLLVLSNCHGYTYHRGMGVWMRVADDSFPASVYNSSSSSAFQNLVGSGDLAHLQHEAGMRRRDVEVVATALATPPAWRLADDRAHLESNIAAAAALQSAHEWKRWLLTYVRQLAADADEMRLREVVLDLLGPLRYSATTHHAQAGRGWEPVFLGIDKRQLLKREVLKELSKNRANHKLVQEVLEMQKEVEEQQQQQEPAGVLGTSSRSRLTALGTSLLGSQAPARVFPTTPATAVHGAPMVHG